ncbi:MAG: hypothetical protein KGY99_01000 [Phycisphaerae bacterium]|nr:hypothetical protein [Phycisphaerae bacterium]
MIDTLRKTTGLDIYEPSICQAGGVTYFLARRGREKLLGHVAPSERQCDAACGRDDVERAGTIDGRPVCLAPCNAANAARVRRALPFTAPKLLGLATSVGLGDRLGLATPGHVAAMRDAGAGVAPIYAQQSIRELARTRRRPQDVMDAATWGVLQAGWRDGFGADADHLQKPEDIDRTVAAGFTFFTIDPGAHVNDAADTMDAAALKAALAAVDCEPLAASLDDLTRRYAGREFPLDGDEPIHLDEEGFARAAVKYAPAIGHVAAMYRHLSETIDRPFELEVSVDETDAPTTPAEHYYFAAELRRLGVQWVSLAPRFIGRFEKGVDYIGDVDAFRASFARHAAVMRTLGPYKISIHSGSDKFSIYPIVAELAGERVHLKTAGTSYLEAVRAIARIDPALFREIYDFARARYDEDRRTYHVSADMSKVPPADALNDDALADRIDDFHTRQALHVTFGSVLTADDGARFALRIYEALETCEQPHYDALAAHLARHIAPFAQAG